MSELPENPKTVVITLRSGVQLKVMVDSFKVHYHYLTGELNEIAWTPSLIAGPRLRHVNLDEVAAIHEE